VVPFGGPNSGSSDLSAGNNSNVLPSLHSDGDSLHSEDDLAEQLGDLHIPNYESSLDSDGNPDDIQMPTPSESIDETEEQKPSQ
jgi:hypothetical protein